MASVTGLGVGVARVVLELGSYEVSIVSRGFCWTIIGCDYWWLRRVVERHGLVQDGYRMKRRSMYQIRLTVGESVLQRVDTVEDDST